MKQCSFGISCPVRMLTCIGLLVLVPGIVLAQRELKEIPQPDPANELASMRVDPAMEVHLFASDPQICKPIQSNFDSHGRLWVASSQSYPQLAPGEIANDKIVVLEDRDGDGVAETSTVFAEGLLIPTGILPDGPHAAYVAHATELLYLEDTDRDGRADRREVVLSGFGTEDTHHLIHTLRWGFDGCVYFNQSIYIHSTIETAYGVRRMDGGGIWRYRPETGQLEVFCLGFVNPWGHVFDAYGQSLATDGAYFEGINHVFPDAVFVTSPGATRWLSGMNPGSPKHCGLAILSGLHVPPEWQGHLVANDFRSHRVCRFSIAPLGSSFQSRQQPEIITSSHRAFRPIDAGVGGDGALYISDWYNPIIQHGEVDFRDERRDREHGRIWRVSFPGRPLDRPRQYAERSVAELVEMLRDPSLAVRQFSRLELKRRDVAAVAAELSRWIEQSADSVEREHRLMEGMWIDECHNRVRPDRLAAVLRAEDGRIRAAGMRIAHWRRSELPMVADILKAGVSDPHPLVRLEAVAALGNGQTKESMEVALGVLEAPLDANIDFALWNAARRLAPKWLPEVAAGTFDFAAQPRRLEFLLSAAGSPEAAEPVIQSVIDPSGTLQLSDAQAAALVGPLAGVANAGQLGVLTRGVLTARRWDQDNRAKLLGAIIDQTARRGVVPQEIEGAILGVLGDRQAGNLGEIAVVAAGAWKVGVAVDLLQARLKLLASDPSRGGAVMALLQALGQIGSQDATAVLEQTVADNGVPAAVRAGSTVALSAARQDRALELFVGLLRLEETRAAAIDRMASLLQRQGFADQLAGGLVELQLGADDARRMLAAARGAGGSEKLAEVIARLGGLENAGWKWSEELASEILQLASSQGDAARGEAIYRRGTLQCITCHAIGEGGGLVGPNLVSLGGAATADYILRSLIDPNDKLKEGYTTTRIVTDDGRVIQGIRAGGNAEAIRLRLADGQVVDVPVNEIDAESAGPSLMPGGLVDSLTRSELADLVRFLGELGKNPQYTVGAKPLVRAVQTLAFTPEANHQMNRTSTDAVTSDDPAFQWRDLTSQVDGMLLVGEMDAYRQHQGIPARSFIRFEIEAGNEGVAGLRIEPAEGMEMWIDGRPTPVESAATMELSPGRHRVILGINRDLNSRGVVVERK